MLLLHGTGGASHSWRDIAPVLAERYRVVVPDLPGHGFTRLGALQRSSPDLMAEDVSHLMAKLDVSPAAVIGHSAGGALAVRLAQRPGTTVRGVIGLNAALENFQGAAGWLFPMMAKGLALNPFAAPAIARLARPAQVDRLIAATGSRLDALGLALYRACISDTRHVDGTLTMMAQWRLSAMEATLPATDLPVLLLAADNDRAVSPQTAIRAAARLPNASAHRLSGLGHLAHEEAPETIVPHLLSFLDRWL